MRTGLNAKCTNLALQMRQTLFQGWFHCLLYVPILSRVKVSVLYRAKNFKNSLYDVCSKMFVQALLTCQNSIKIFGRGRVALVFEFSKRPHSYQLWCTTKMNIQHYLCDLYYLQILNHSLFCLVLRDVIGRIKTSQ